MMGEKLTTNTNKDLKFKEARTVQFMCIYAVYRYNLHVIIYPKRTR